MAELRRRHTILVTDDDDDVHAIAHAYFGSRGHTVVSAYTGKDCIRLAREIPDIIVLDLRLPDMDGRKVASRLKTDPRTSTIPILGVSGVINMQAEMLLAGCDDFMLKPVLPRDLLDKIELMVADRERQGRA